MVRSISFWITSACILVAVLASLLAIWKFAGTDILWRTVATCSRTELDDCPAQPMEPRPPALQTAANGSAIGV